MNLPLKEKIKTIAISILEAIFLYILIIVPAEYFLTERFSVFPFLSPDVKTFIFFVVLVIIFTVNYFSQPPKKYSWLFILTVFILTGLSVFGYKKYLIYYAELQNYPKIYSVSEDWGIQASLIIIEGKNFGPTWQPGRIFVDNFELRIKYWSPCLVVAEQPVPPKFFKGNLYLQDSKNRRSNGRDFEIKDPDSLK